MTGGSSKLSASRFVDAAVSLDALARSPVRVHLVRALRGVCGRNFYNLEIKEKHNFSPFSEKYLGSRVFVQKHNFQEKKFYEHAVMHQPHHWQLVST